MSRDTKLVRVEKCEDYQELIFLVKTGDLCAYAVNSFKSEYRVRLQRGEPLGTLSLGERRAYWAMYNEFLNSNEALVRRQGSDRIQQMLADFTTDKARFNIPDDWSSKMGGLPYLDLLNYLQNTKGLNISDNKG